MNAIEGQVSEIAQRKLRCMTPMLRRWNQHRQKKSICNHTAAHSGLGLSACSRLGIMTPETVIHAVREDHGETKKRSCERCTSNPQL